MNKKTIITMMLTLVAMATAAQKKFRMISGIAPMISLFLWSFTN